MYKHDSQKIYDLSIHGEAFFFHMWCLFVEEEDQEKGPLYYDMAKEKNYLASMTRGFNKMLETIETPLSEEFITTLYCHAIPKQEGAPLQIIDVSNKVSVNAAITEYNKKIHSSKTPDERLLLIATCLHKISISIRDKRGNYRINYY